LGAAAAAAAAEGLPARAAAAAAASKAATALVESISEWRVPTEALPALWNPSSTVASQSRPPLPLARLLLARRSGASGASSASGRVGGGGSPTAAGFAIALSVAFGLCWVFVSLLLRRSRKQGTKRAGIRSSESSGTSVAAAAAAAAVGWRAAAGALAPPAAAPAVVAPSAARWARQRREQEERKAQQQQLKPFASPSFGRIPQSPAAQVAASSSSSSLLFVPPPSTAAPAPSSSSDFSPAMEMNPPYYSAVTARVDALIAELDRLVERE